MRNIKFWLLGVLAFLFSFGGVALAADAVDPQDGSFDLAKSIYNAFAGHHYAYAGALGVILGVALIKRYLGPKIPWLHSDIGGTSMTLMGASATALSASLAGGGPVTLALMKTALLVGVGAAGGYSVIKKLVIEPLIKPLQAKLPAWAQPIFSLVLWVFDKPDAIVAQEAAAAQAGAAAVAANPGQGVSALPAATALPGSTVGAPTEVK